MRRIIYLCLILAFTAAFNTAYAQEDTILHRTGHFEFEIPNGAIKQSTDKYTFFYMQEAGSFAGGMLRISESEVGQINTEDQLKAAYGAYVSAIEEGVYCTSKPYSEFIEIDGDLAIYVTYTENVNSVDEPIHAVAYYMNDYLLILTYLDTSSQNEKDDILGIANTIKYRFEKDPEIHVFDKNFIQVIGYEVITQNSKDYLAVELEWWHTQKEPHAFTYSFDIEAYQRGRECTNAFILNENTAVKLERLADIKCHLYFELYDTTSPVNLYIDGLYDFLDQYEDAIYELDITN